MAFRIIVTGGRHYTGLDTVRTALKEINSYAEKENLTPIILIHGNASGADTLASKIAAQLKWKQELFPADWNKHGRSAGPIRNRAMVTSGADILIAFPGGTGTANCIKQASQAGIPIATIHNENTEINVNKLISRN